jgi:diguanylate cyclase (GGDEF)-like protein/PAS domain S-box-containing protein
VWHDEGFVHVMDGVRISDPEEWLRSIHPDDAARVAENIAKLAAGAPVRPEITYRIEMRGRPVRWLVSHIDVVERDEAGRAVVLAGTIAEATELQQANAQVARLLDYMTDGYLTVTTDGRIGYVNRRAAELVGMTREELVGVALVDAFPGAVVNGVSTLIAQAMEGEAVQAEAHFAPLDQWFDVRANPLPEGVAVYFHDVTDRHRAEEERGRLLARAEQASRDLAHAATHDPLTDLPNRAALAAWLERSHARSTDRAPLSLLFIDLDRFKLVNDSHGHAEGDALLVEAGRRLRRVVRPGDLVVRLGGDEFVVAVDGLDELDAVALAERVVQAFRDPFQVADRRLVVTSSVGIAFAGPGATPETLIRDADAALYQAKDAGRNRTGIFDDEVRQRAIARIGIEADLRDLLEVGGLGAHFQPSFDLATGVVVGVEALARWDHPVRGPVPPTDFIPVAEETGLVVEVGEAMLELAIAAVEQLDRCAEVAGASIWVNVSVRQLDDPGFADRLVARLQRCGALHRIGVEVTESAMARDAATGAAALRDLSAAGIELAIDDFGTGWSSLGRLVERPVEVLKVDRSFLDGIGSEAGMRVVAAIIDLAHAIGAEAWAEGVETEDQLARLRTLGVDKVSGYLLCPPVPLDDLATGAAAGRRLLDQDRDRGLPTRR